MKKTEVKNMKKKSVSEISKQQALDTRADFIIQWTVFELKQKDILINKIHK
jgi:hypothetical protein